MLKSLIVAFVLIGAPALAQDQTSVTTDTPSLGVDGDAIYCRPPQHRSDSQLMGPKVCMTNRQWAELRQGGFEIGPDGVKVAIQKHMDMLTH